MSAWLTIAVRFGLYLDLMLLFGISLFGLCAFRREELRFIVNSRMGGLMAGLAGLGLVLSFVALAVMAKAMSGADDFTAIGQHVYAMVLMQTDVGIAWLVRMVALVLAIAATTLCARSPTIALSLIAAMAISALASLAWAGHGAMDAGPRGAVHLSADIVHLAAAALWVGALAVFMLLATATSNLAAERHIRLLGKALNGFATMGTVIVATLIATGLANYWLINGSSLDGLTTATYGLLLIAKLFLFVLMLGLAAANRFHLSPRLEASIRIGNVTDATAALRRSLLFEFSAAVAILALVAWLGTLSPSGAAMP